MTNKMAYKDYSNLKDEFKDIIEYCKNKKVGDKIKFESEKQRYTIKAKSDRYLICTKPFNLKRTCLYCIIDLERLVRGPNDRVFNCYDYTIQEDIDQSLKDLLENKIGVSHRKSILLDTEMI